MSENGEHESKPEEDTSSEEGIPYVELADFQAVDIEEPIAGSRCVSCEGLASLYQEASKSAGDKNAASEARVFGLLAAICQIHFKPNDQAEPYGPLLVMDGRRSLIPSDLRGEQAAVLAEIVPTVENPGLRARLTDIVWLNDRSRAAMAPLAISSFRETVSLIFEGKAELRFEDHQAGSHQAVALLRRACQIGRLTGWKETDTDALKSLVTSITDAAFRSGEAGGYLNIGELNADYRIDEPATIAAQAEHLAKLDDLHPETARHLWELAARAHRQNEDEEHSNRCLVSAAECYVRMAEAADNKGMAAASWLMDAIKALRHIPGTKERRQELEAVLRQAQESVSDEMGTISTPVDLSDLVDEARRTIHGLTLAQALAQFATLATSPDPDTLYRQAREHVQEHPLSGFIAMSVHDEEGKVVTQSPGLTGDSETQDDHLRHIIAQNESFRRHTFAYGVIETARRVINAEHPIETRDILPLAEYSPFVPAGHEDLYALGFARFFNGDFISALHILMPQLENSLRYVLKQADVDPSAIQSDMTQENRNLSVMLNRDRETLESIFGGAIVFEIENLFDFRGGPALRHQLAHGLLSAGECYGADSIYACWFIFRLCTLPLLPHWQQVTKVYEQL